MGEGVIVGSFTRRSCALGAGYGDLERDFDRDFARDLDRDFDLRLDRDLDLDLDLERLLDRERERLGRLRDLDFDLRFTYFRLCPEETVLSVPEDGLESLDIASFFLTYCFSRSSLMAASYVSGVISPLFKRIK